MAETNGQPTDAIRAGGYLVEEQGQLPLEEQDEQGAEA